MAINHPAKQRGSPPKPLSGSKQHTRQRLAYHGNESPDEAEVEEVVRVDTGGRVDLQAVVAVAGVLKEAVHGVQHVMGQVEKPFPGNTANNIANGSDDTEMFTVTGNMKQTPTLTVESALASLVLC